MRLSAFGVAVASIVIIGASARQSAAHDLDLKSAWFIPSMAVNGDPICDTLLADVRGHFELSESWDSSSTGAGEYFTQLKKIPGPFENGAGKEPTVEPQVGDPRVFAIIGPGGKRLYAYFQNNSGCGGACETSQLEISEEPFAGDHYRKSDPNESQVASTPASYVWTLYKSDKGAHYVIGIVDRHLHAYRIAAPKDWKISCDIALAPDRLRESADPAVRSALKWIDELGAAVMGLTRGEGNCGSSRTASRWNGYIADALEQTLYRPWALRQSVENARQSENSYGDYSRIIGQLRLWSLGGLSEYQAFAAYEEKLAHTLKQLSRFYREKYGWSSEIADVVAQDALEYAVSQGMGFYMYEPYPVPGEAELRAAILEHRRMHDIQIIQADKATLTAVLDAAVQYPEALRYLLAQGANANAVNDFGKTPLMYAAQYDQFESAKLLLAAGADPNAATTWASDTCNYTLQTSRMTPLHYAVRYASPKVVRLLLDSGASTFSKTEKYYSPISEYPLDWLKRYTDPAAAERNANIPEAEIPKLVALLGVPGEAELAAISSDLTLQAEADYAKGRVEKAYRELMAALSAKPDNERALMDLPIVAFRSGRPGLSLKAADAVLMKSKNAGTLASAWFNKGLVCEQNGFKPIDYDGWYYCMDDPVRPFLQAWKLGHTKTRREKLEKLLREESPRTCTIQKAGLTAPRYRFESGREDEYKDRRNVTRIYAYHDSAQTVDPARLKWTVQEQDQVNKGSMKKTTISPNVVGRHELGHFAITELKIDFIPSGPLRIGDQPCTFHK